MQLKFDSNQPYQLEAIAEVVDLFEGQARLESEKNIAALALLHPLFALRHSATHRNPYNMIYRLTPYEAYR